MSLRSSVRSSKGSIVPSVTLMNGARPANLQALVDRAVKIDNYQQERWREQTFPSCFPRWLLAHPQSVLRLHEGTARRRTNASRGRRGPAARTETLAWSGHLLALRGRGPRRSKLSAPPKSLGPPARVRALVGETQPHLSPSRLTLRGPLLWEQRVWHIKALVDSGADDSFIDANNCRACGPFPSTTHTAPQSLRYKRSPPCHGAVPYGYSQVITESRSNFS